MISRSGLKAVLLVKMLIAEFRKKAQSKTHVSLKTR